MTNSLYLLSNTIKAGQAHLQVAGMLVQHAGMPATLAEEVSSNYPHQYSHTSLLLSAQMASDFNQTVVASSSGLHLPGQFYELT